MQLAVNLVAKMVTFIEGEVAVYTERCEAEAEELSGRSGNICITILGHFMQTDFLSLLSSLLLSLSACLSLLPLSSPYRSYHHPPLQWICCN